MQDGYINAEVGDTHLKILQVNYNLVLFQRDSSVSLEAFCDLTEAVDVSFVSLSYIAYMCSNLFSGW